MKNSAAYEKIRIERVEAAKTIGDYYRDVISYWYALGNDPDELDTRKTFRPDSSRGKKLLLRAKKQFNNKLEMTEDGYVKIRCEYCNKTFIINNIDLHSLSCDKRKSQIRNYIISIIIK